MNFTGLESLFTIDLGFKEILNTIIGLIENSREENKKRFVSELQRNLQKVSFNEIEEDLNKVIKERKITVSSRNNLIHWYTNTADSLDAAIPELKRYYIATSNDSKTELSKLAHLPKSWNNIEIFRNLILGKQMLRNKVQEYITIHIGHKVGELTPEEIQYIELLLSEMKQVNEQIGELYDSLNKFLE